MFFDDNTLILFNNPDVPDDVFADQNNDTHDVDNTENNTENADSVSAAVSPDSGIWEENDPLPGPSRMSGEENVHDVEVRSSELFESESSNCDDSTENRSAADSEDSEPAPGQPRKRKRKRKHADHLSTHESSSTEESEEDPLIGLPRKKRNNDDD